MVRTNTRLITSPPPLARRHVQLQLPPADAERHWQHKHQHHHSCQPQQAARGEAAAGSRQLTGVKHGTRGPVWQKGMRAGARAAAAAHLPGGDHVAADDIQAGMLPLDVLHHLDLEGSETRKKACGLGAGPAQPAGRLARAGGSPAGAAPHPILRATGCLELGVLLLHDS